MMIRNWIILGIAVAAILTYVIGIPPSISAEYSKSRAHYSTQTNECGNGDAGNSFGAKYLTSSYESLADNVFCSNTGSQVQGEDNGVAMSSSQR
jgi:hypothetical protein